MKRLFGTDGMRGVAGQFPLEYSSIYVLGKALTSILIREEYSPRILIGRDTRESGSWIEKALFQGILDGKGKPTSAGIIPTSAISFLTLKYSFSAGIVISASHNPYQDNGIKIFSANGIKISDALEKKLEKTILSSKETIQEQDTAISPDHSLSQDYIEFLISRFSPGSFSCKKKVVLDSSNGSSSSFAAKIFSKLGVEVIPIHDTPDGKNINANCGSLYPQNLAKKVLETGADLGVAYDGDADRALWINEKGILLNGDHTLYILARYMQRQGSLKSNTIVATIMSNIGLERALHKMGLKLFRAPVGDRYVLEQMLKIKSNLGGEQSGHTILLDDCPTGDGILTSIKILEAMTVENSSLSELVENYQVYPQTLKNVKVASKENFSQFPEIINIIEKIKGRLGDSGRINVRYSGTEPLARVMIEGQVQTEIGEYAQQIADVITKHLT